MTSFPRKLAASAMLTGLLALSASIATGSHGQATRVASNASQSSPDIRHHWPNVAVADANPAILHHWLGNAVTTAEADPAIRHHWPTANTKVADIDPEIRHHWA